MFFTDREKTIYESPSGQKYDPLRVDRLLSIASGNRVHELLKLRDPATVSSGDVSKRGRAEAEVEACRAELELADAARKAFGLPEFPQCTDAECLETLYHFLEWMAGKDETAGTPQSAPQTGYGSRPKLTPSSSH